MFAARSAHPAKTPEGEKPEGVDHALKNSASPEPNPLWQSLALHPVPLDADVRLRYERGLGTSLADVRIHADEQGAASANALDAKAYTIGRDIVFGAGLFDPKSFEGQRLLTHELAHVVQQRAATPAQSALAISRPGDPAERAADRVSEALLAGRAADFSAGSQPVAIYRNGQNQPATEQTAAPEARVRQWLEQHQFAPPERQPEQGEQHVLINGEDMPLRRAVELASAELHFSPEVVRPIIVAALTPRMPYSARGATFVGRGNLVPGLPLFPQTHEDNVILSKALELSRIDDWLDARHFYQRTIPDPLGVQVVLDGRNTTIAEVADRAIAILGQNPFLTRQEVVVHLRQRYVAAPSGPGTQMVVSYTFVPRGGQAVVPAPDPLHPLINQHTLGFGITLTHHTSDEPGRETSFQGSVTLNDAGQIVNIQVQAQEALVLALLNNWIQVSGFVQLMASVNWNRPAMGTATISPAIQAGVGAQVLFTPPLFRQVRMFNGHVSLLPPQIGVQVVGTVQQSFEAPIGPPQAGISAGVFINIPFNLF